MLSLVLLLAQACVGEIDLQGNPEECVAMWHILDEKPRDLEYVTKRYISIFKVQSPRSQWILSLNLDGTKPSNFPHDATWEGRNKKGWQAIVKKAQAFVQDPGRHPCPQANQFGGPIDGRHADDAVPPCWIPVQCGEGFAQAYYHRPAGGCTVKASAVVAAFSE